MWSMDLVADACADGRRFRALTVLDLYTCECLAIEAGRTMTGQTVAAILERVRVERGVPGASTATTAGSS
jgi:putative transposase